MTGFDALAAEFADEVAIQEYWNCTRNEAMWRTFHRFYDAVNDASEIWREEERRESGS